jgi:hypothetical protein
MKHQCDISVGTVIDLIMPCAPEHERAPAQTRRALLIVVNNRP